LRLAYQKDSDTGGAMLGAKQCHRMIRFHLVLLKMEWLKSKTYQPKKEPSLP
jgi:hypothetical protein